MNSHATGERLGWLLAAALVAAGSAGFVGNPPASQASSPRVATIGDAVTAAGRAELGTRGPSGGLRYGPTAALAADAFGWPDPLAAVAPAVKVTKPPAAPAKASSPKPAPVWWSIYRGANHVWMPTLGMSRPVYWFSCSRSRDPYNYVYRWGCAGRNNVYLLGHAWGVFKVVHDAYYNGRLKVGMPVIYADSTGRVHLYRVTTWRVVSPYNASWAMASQSRPSMTLQTCIGPNGSLRLVVRLVQVNS